MRPGLWVLCAGAFVGACATVPESVDTTDGLSFEQRRAALEALPGWEMRGRLAVDTGDRGFSGRLRWRKEAGRLVLTVSGAIGGGLQIAGSEDNLTVRFRGETYQLNDPEAQLSELLGWWLPVTSLDTWLLGLPDELFAAESQTMLDGRLSSLEQRLWRLDYTAYELTEGWLLPRRIEMIHERLHFRLTVDTWQPVPAAAERLN